MPGLLNASETALLELLFKNTPWVGIGSNLPGASTPGSFYISLYVTPGPNEDGSGHLNEADYDGYARVAVARSGSGWTVSGGQATNAAQILFPPCTSGTNVITHFGICRAGDVDTDDAIIFGTCSLTVNTGVQPKFEPGELDVNID